ncbi:MAG TPA: archaemetzincin [Planctomycetota bacterium]|nr:archaemetzincin [Planctomycetota bacterium]
MRLLALALLLVAARDPDVPAPKGTRRLPPPAPGEWRWTFPEEGQTFAEYQASGPVRPTAERKLIYLAPFLTRPPRDPDLLAMIGSVLGPAYHAEVRILPPRPLPSGAYVPSRRQVSALALAPHLVADLPRDALFVLAVTDRDLFVGDLSRAFGWGSLSLRVGVLSTARIGAEDDPSLARRRTLTLALHETGHLLSLPHCTFYRCLMNGALTMKEADARPATLCPVCRAKLCWNLGVDAAARERALSGGFSRAGMTADAEDALTAAETKG